MGTPPLPLRRSVPTEIRDHPHSEGRDCRSPTHTRPQASCDGTRCFSDVFHSNGRGCDYRHNPFPHNLHPPCTEDRTHHVVPSATLLRTSFNFHSPRDWQVRTAKK